MTISGFYDEISGKLDVQLSIIKELGESCFCPRRLDKKTITDYTYEEFLEKVKPKLEQAGVSFSSIGSSMLKIPIKDNARFEEQLIKFKELIKIAKEMNCKYIRVFSFYMPKGETPNKYRDEVIEKIKILLDLVEGTDICLLHENEKRIYGDIPERVLDLYYELNHPNFKLCFDASNYTQCGINSNEAYEQLKEITDYYHIKDCDKVSGIEVPLGFGETDYKSIIAELIEKGYDGFLTLEPHTAKYALIRKPVYFIPFMPLILNKYYKLFRRIDRELGKSIFSKVSLKEIFVLQYENLTSIILEGQKI